MSEAARCVQCTHFVRCAALIRGLTGAETSCDFVPSRFVRASKWRRASNRARAVGNGHKELGGHFAAKGRLS